jgi:uncharacterized membrane protein
MSRLAEVYDEKSSRWAVVRATLVLVGSLVAVVGFVIATASLVAGFGLEKSSAIKVATLLGGVLLLGGFVVLFGRKSTTAPTRLLASVGATFGVVGLVLFWSALPTGWTGQVGGLPPLAAGTYAAGLLAVFAAKLVVGDDDEDSSVSAPDSASVVSDADSLDRVETPGSGPNDRDGVSSSAAVGDGGADDDDLQFFDDEDA